MERIGLIGTGLIGSSLGMALVRAGYRVTGYDSEHAESELALRNGAITSVAASPADAVRSAGIILLAVPPLAIQQTMATIAPHLAQGALVSDVASVKSIIMNWAAALLPSLVTFIGGHPMAGKERSGAGAAEATLFRGATYCLVPPPGTPGWAIDQMIQLVRACGAHELLLDAQTHDLMVAAISHLPFAASAALVQAVVNTEQWPASGDLAAGGFRDLSRLAGGSPRMHTDIVSANASNMLTMLDRYIAELLHLRELIQQSQDPPADSGRTDHSTLSGLFSYFAQAQVARQEWYTRYRRRIDGQTTGAGEA